MSNQLLQQQIQELGGKHSAERVNVVLVDDG